MGLPEVILLGVNLVPLTIDFVGFYALYMAISLSLNLEFGYGGIPNFGKVLFVAGGAAVAGLITGRIAQLILGVGLNLDYIAFNNRIMAQIDTLLLKNPLVAVELIAITVLLAAVVGGVLGYLASYPAIRLREDYLGLFLLGVAQFSNILLRTYTSEPLQVPDPYVYFSNMGPDVRDLVATSVMVVFAVLVYIYVERSARSPLSRTLRAIRDNEDAAEALGKDVTKARRNALIVASAIAAIAGALYSFQYTYFAYDTWTRFAWTFWPFLIVILGGAANNSGVLLGTFSFAALLKGLELEQAHLQPYIFFDASFLQDLIFAAVLLLILFLRPDGILKEKSSSTLPRGVLRRIMGPKEGPGGEPDRGGGRFARMRSRMKRVRGRGGDGDAGSG